MFYFLNSIFLFFFFTSITILNAIRCFQCGSESIFMNYAGEKTRVDNLENTLLTLESCSNLEFPFASWGTSAVDCAPDQICVKTIIDEGFDENGRHRYVTGSRGCAMRSTAQGHKHRMGCGILRSNAVPPTETFQNKWDLICFCEDDYCNGAQRTGVSFSALIGPLSSLISCLLWSNFGLI